MRNELSQNRIWFFSDGPVVLPPPAAAISPSGCFLLNMGDNTRIAQLSALLPPSLAFQEVPGDMPTYHQVVETRQQVLDILSGADDRLVVVLGPPADSEPAALTELATQLQALKPKFEKELLLIVLADAALQPEGTEAVQINRGLRQARELLLQINRLGLPTACEFADTITPQFFADLLSWSCVSAGNETLRELVSGLSMPAGLRAHVDATSPERMAAVCASLADAAGPQVGGHTSASARTRPLHTPSMHTPVSSESLTPHSPTHSCY